MIASLSSEGLRVGVLVFLAAFVSKKLPIAIAVLLILGVALRLTGLGVHSLWIDEGGTLFVARSADLLETTCRDHHPPLSFLLYRGWIALLGEDDRILRLLPALFSTASLLLFARLASEWSSSRGRVVTIALYAVSPFHVWYGQEIRMYALLELAAMATLLCAARYLRVPKLGWLLLLFASTAFAFGVHYMGVLLLPSVIAIAWLAERHGRIQRNDAVRMVIATAVGLAAWTPWVVFAVEKQMGTRWAYISTMSPMEIAALPARQMVNEVAWLPAPLRAGAYALAAILSAGVLSFLLGAIRTRRFEARLILVGFAAPVAAAVVCALVGHDNYQPRYMMAAAPCSALMIGEGIASLGWGGLRNVLAGAAVAGCLGLTLIHRAENRRDDFRAASLELEWAWKPGDVIVVITGLPPGFAESVVVHYLRDDPPLLQSLRSPEDVLESNGAPPAGAIVHVIYRDADFSRPAMSKMLEAFPSAHRGEIRNRVQYLRLKG